MHERFRYKTKEELLKKAKDLDLNLPFSDDISPLLGSPTAHESIWKPELCIYDREIEKKILEVTFRSGSLKINLADVREIPKQDLWFERVWKEYIEDIYFDC